MSTSPSPTVSFHLSKKILEYRLQNKLNMENAIKFTQEALKTQNLRAIEILAETYPHIVADVLQIDFTNSDLILESTNLAFQLKDHFNEKFKRYILQKIVPRLINRSEKLFQRINRGKYPNSKPYIPGRRWNVEKTLEKFLTSGDSNFVYNHVVCEEKIEKEPSLLLLIDKSHSVFKYLQWIIITSILFSLALKNKKLGILCFDTKPMVLKSIDHKIKNSDEVVQKLVNISSGGKTDIFSALDKAISELGTQRSSKKIVVMISDLLPTSGRDFLPLLRQIEDVRIIVTPRRQTFQLTKPLLGHLRRMNNVNLFLMPQNERLIPKMLERVLYL
ncbi:MAG: vWA domain-containing protein [Candidatus Hodarchaeales archaeon]|jgi:hypothetical protein